MRKVLIAAAVVTAVVIVFTPFLAPSQVTCPNDAARNLMVTNYMDSLLNSPKGEDTEFFTIEGSVPNLMFVVDTSGSMQRLPPDGPAYMGGPPASTPRPAGYVITSRSNSTQQTNAYNSGRVVGCNLDPVFNSTSNVGDNAMLQSITTRRFYSPCGQAVDQTTIGDAYRGHYGLVTGGVDYGAQMTVCPHYTPSNSQQTGDPGFDPDYYSSTPTATTVGSKPVYFGRDLVFHDSDLFNAAYSYSSSLAFHHNFGNGWTDSAVYPAKISSSTLADIDSFCNLQGTAAQGTSDRASICKLCLKQAGWYFDGVILNDGDYNFPSIWYTGNYLSFFPPKFVIAKKVMKDTIAVQSKIRMALGHLDNTGSVQGLTLDKEFNPTCDHPESSFDSNRSTFVNLVDAFTFTGGTPLAEALFDVGHYYHSADLTWFGSSFAKSSMQSPTNKNQFSICYSCQSSSVVLITDGIANGSGPFPSGTTTIADTTGKYAGDTSTGILGITSATCPTCNQFGGASEDNLAKVAWYMHNMDLRRNNETTADCSNNGGKQVLDVYTVGFATSQLPVANQILSGAAQAGGGQFIQADNTELLRTGLAHIVESINTRGTSFSVATVSTLQTTSGRAVIVPRFEPSKSAQYKGHLLRFDLYSEFVNTCDAKSDGTGTGDLDCDGSCTSVFLQDMPATPGGAGDFVVEDSFGNFVKNDPGDAANCAQAPKCLTTAGKSCSPAGTLDATPWWDSGELLAGTTTSQKWKSRTVWTVVDSNGDGKINASDTVFRLQPTDTVANSIIPYLGLGGGTICDALAVLLNTAGNSARATTIRSDQVECAKTLIRYVLGADVLNSQKATSGYPASSEDDLWDRAWLLGDIFHSSPVVVDPPLPRSGVICPNGLSNQCLQSLWKTPTDSGGTAYDGYSLSTAYQYRRKIVLVGANDGLLHAFNAGIWHAYADDPYTTGLDESLSPFDGYYDRGDGSELWAFLPPDMLAKVPLLATASQHQYYVDGTPMVRDVWVDGSRNKLGIGTVDDIKQAEEYHTVAVFGERRGGTHFFALDVTDATESGVKPDFLWIYPQPNDPESLTFGETFDDYLPRPPPIGPVRVAAGGTTYTKTLSMLDAAGTMTPYRERWVAFLNGGYDTQYVRGRGVHMVDVWTGAEIFDFSYSSDTTKVQNALRFPVPSTVGMVGWGTNVKREVFENNQYFFDTATFGDAGGQLWVLRFHYPGTLGADGRATNWVGGRVFQMGTSSSACKLCAGQPFFYMTANIPLPENGAYRVYAGTGDRYNLLDVYGGTCGPDNLRACVLRGCTVTVDQTGNLLESYGLGSAARGLSQTACGAMTNSETNGTVATCVMNGKAKIEITGCPSGSGSSTKETEVKCTYGTDGYACAQSKANIGSKVDVKNTSITLGNWFYSLLVFEDTGNRTIFNTATQASSYDGARLWLNQTGVDASYRFTGSYSTGIVPIAAVDPAPATLASATSKGWALYYDQGPTVTADGHIYNVYWADERTSSGSSTLNDIYWNTMMPGSDPPTSGGGSCVTNMCGVIQARRIASKYGANVTTGALPSRLYDPSTGAVVRSVKSALLVPTQADQPTVFVNQKGQIAMALTAVNPERGATNVGQTDPIDPSQDYGVTEVSETTHQCRHADTAATAVCK